MQDKQDRKEYIIQKAFEVFMAKGYESVSMTVLQQELKMSRGAMYRYFESKDDLFRAVIDKYFFGLIDFILPKFDENITVAEMIETSYESLKKVSRLLDNIEGLEVVFFNFTALLIQAAKKYPGFLKRMENYKETSLKSWQVALENSIKNREIRKDIDSKIMAVIFSKAFGTTEPDRPTKNFSKTVDETKRTMIYLYSLIKT